MGLGDVHRSGAVGEHTVIPEESRRDSTQLPDMTEGGRPQKVPDVDGVFTPGSTLCPAPSRRASRSSMLSAQVNIPATIELAFAAASHPVPLATVSFEDTRAPRPARRANRITGTRPAEGIRFVLSKVAATLGISHSCNSRMAFLSGALATSQSPSSLFNRHPPVIATPNCNNSRGGSRLTCRGAGCDTIARLGHVRPEVIPEHGPCWTAHSGAKRLQRGPECGGEYHPVTHGDARAKYAGQALSPGKPVPGLEVRSSVRFALAQGRTASPGAPRGTGNGDLGWATRSPVGCR